MKYRVPTKKREEKSASSRHRSSPSRSADKESSASGSSWSDSSLSGSSSSTGACAVTTSLDRKRLVWVALSLFGFFALLIVQFYKIQIIEGEKWTKVAAAQHQLVVVEPFKRGLFYSNASVKRGHPDQPQPFVVDIPKFHLYADPLQLPPNVRGEVANHLAAFLGLPGKDRERLFLQLGKKSRFCRLSMWSSREERDLIEQWWFGYARSKKLARNALYFIQDYRRSYPFGKMLGQVLHTVRDTRDVRTHQSIPTGGLEMIYNSYLQGKEGKRLMIRSPHHPLEVGKVLAYPEDGADIYLTINHYLQAIAEEEIAKATQAANAKAGWAVMMDPYTGEILALAQYPWFDPSAYRQYFNDPQLREHTKVKAITDPFEPGSTMKPLTIAIALEANAELQRQGKPPLFSPAEKIPTAVGLFPGRKPLKDVHTHNYLNMEMAIQKSSSVYCAKLVHRIVERLGNQWYRQKLEELFGFGHKTGIELPAESSGLLPTIGKKNPNGTLQWSTPTPYSLAMGHNILTTGLQMVQSYAILANGGYAVTPTLVRKIVKRRADGSEEVLLDHTKSSEGKKQPRVLDADIVTQVVRAMKYTTKAGGTATRADIPGYTEAGKTGTSEKIVGGSYSKKSHLSSFMGFAPAENPRFVLLIALDEPEWKIIPGVGKNQQGGICAAPAFREIGARALQYLGATPDDPYGYGAGDPRASKGIADWAQNTRALRELYNSWNK